MGVLPQAMYVFELKSLVDTLLAFRVLGNSWTTSNDGVLKMAEKGILDGIFDNEGADLLW